ncbi:MAG TPA: hypothetical protein VN829_06770 [Dongiaceae bacterium]|nr:hypothetical protein [Dongiaceae bacterium]
MNSERSLILLFLAFLVAIPVSQAVLELRRGERPQALSLFGQRPTAPNLRAYERDLEDASQAARWARPWVQYAQFAWFKDGGEKVLLGRDGWLFYKPGVQYLTQRPGTLWENSTAAQALAAIVSLRDQLDARGIRLLVVPAPNKESVYPDKLTRRAERLPGVVCEETRTLLSGLRAAGVEVVDVFELFASARKAGAGASLYLAQDSHWSPLGAQLAAEAVARRVLEQGWIKAGDVEYEQTRAPLERRGDILRMLQAPALERRLGLEAVLCAQVPRRDNHQLYRDQAGSELLVLGDSFLRIYQTDEPGSAGFIAHLAKALKRPLVSIVNDGGASTLVRQELCRRSALLSNVKVVVWEFVERDIRLGTEGWQILQLPERSKPYVK